MEQHTARSGLGEAGAAVRSTRQAPPPGPAAAAPTRAQTQTQALPQAQPQAQSQAQPQPRTQPRPQPPAPQPERPATNRPTDPRTGTHPAPNRPTEPRTGTHPATNRPTGSRPAGKRRPRPRLTGLGAGTLIMVMTVGSAAIDAMLFHGPGLFFGVVFVAVSVVGAVYVRPYDLVAAPVAAPIAFAVAIALTAGSGTDGLAGHVLGVFTALALMTGWLYTGTVAAALIVAVRAVRLPWRRRRSPRCSGAPRERSPR